MCLLCIQLIQETFSNDNPAHMGQSERKSERKEMNEKKTTHEFKQIKMNRLAKLNTVLYFIPACLLLLLSSFVNIHIYRLFNCLELKLIFSLLLSLLLLLLIGWLSFVGIILNA